MEKIIAEQLNIKSINVSKKDEISVVLDTKLTPKLEAEGYAREVSRKVQAFRKKLGLEKHNVIELALVVDDEFKKILEINEEFIKERTNSKILSVTTGKETFKNNIEFKIKEKRGVIGIKVD